jgi:purine-binding chemotaxis protein CheW
MINTTDESSTRQANGPNEENGTTKVGGGKFLTFFLAGEEYGIEILSVHEIIGMMPITSVPGTPDYICGVINLRGKVIPIVDIRKKFGMDFKEYDSETCIIVVNVQGVEAGAVVDRVSEVLNIADEDIEPPPSFGKDVQVDFIMGIGKSQSKVKILLDIDRVISSVQILQLHKMVSGETSAHDNSISSTGA